MRKIIWDRQAAIQLSKAISFIRNNSPQNADQVKKEILENIETLLLVPEKYSPDEYKKNNKGNYRAFELHCYRVSYFIKEEEIIIARIRHTSMKPKKY